MVYTFSEHLKDASVYERMSSDVTTEAGTFTVTQVSV